MSRTPLRDAMIRLELEGFVTVYPRRGVMVCSLEPPDIRDIYQIIGALEASVVERMALRFRSSDADRMDGFRAKMAESLSADDFDAYYSPPTWPSTMSTSTCRTTPISCARCGRSRRGSTISRAARST
jgi:hypothetical protein